MVSAMGDIGQCNDRRQLHSKRCNAVKCNLCLVDLRTNLQIMVGEKDDPICDTLDHCKHC